MFQMSTANFSSTTNPSSSSTTSTYSPFRLTTPSIVSLSTTENLLPLSNHHSQPSTPSSIFSSICIDTPVLGQLPSTIVKHEEQQLTNNEKNLDDCTQMSNAPDPIDHGEDSEIELFINNVVCSFASGCPLNLKKIAMEAANVIYRRDQSVSDSPRRKFFHLFVVVFSFSTDGFNENSKSLLFGQFMVIG